MLLVGDNSPHDEDVIEMNGRMDPEKTDFMKVIILVHTGSFQEVRGAY